MHVRGSAPKLTAALALILAALPAGCRKHQEDDGWVRLPDIAVPLATQAGWNYRDPSIGAPARLAGEIGSYIPFARSRADRERAHDPRPSIEERYASRDDLYVSGAILIQSREGGARIVLPTAQRKCDYSFPVRADSDCGIENIRIRDRDITLLRNLYSNRACRDRRT